MERDFTIVKVGWLTKTPGNLGRRHEIISHVYAISEFLQENKLSKKKLYNDFSDIDDDYEINSYDLTEEGLLFMRRAYEKWLTKVDNGMSPENTLTLERELIRIRAK